MQQTKIFWGKVVKDYGNGVRIMFSSVREKEISTFDLFHDDANVMKRMPEEFSIAIFNIYVQCGN